MADSINKIAIIGSGVIGVGWALRFISHHKDVYVFDPSIKQINYLNSEYKRTKFILKKFYNLKNISYKKIHIVKSIKDAVKEADLVQENVPEN